MSWNFRRASQLKRGKGGRRRDVTHVVLEKLAPVSEDELVAGESLAASPLFTVAGREVGTEADEESATASVVADAAIDPEAEDVLKPKISTLGFRRS